MDQQGPVLGATLYAFTTEWRSGMYTFEQMIEKVAELGLGPGVEVVGFQSLRSYPDVSDEEAGQIRDLLGKHGLIPSCLGGNLDVGRRRDRPMDLDEMVAYLERQIWSAQKMGFPVLRIQMFPGLKLFEKLAPIAEKAKVQVAGELHSPLSANHPEVVALREGFDRLGTEYVGFVPDFSASMTRVPAIYWDHLRALGASEELIEAVGELWSSDQPPGAKFPKMAELARRFGASPALAGRLNTCLTMFGRMPVSEWAILFPYARHIHGKFYGVTAQGVEPSIPYPQILQVVKQSGYQGTISGEWEGHAFTEQKIGFQQAQAWHAMVTGLLAG